MGCVQVITIPESRFEKCRRFLSTVELSKTLIRIQIRRGLTLFENGSSPAVSSPPYQLWSTRSEQEQRTA